MRFTQWSVIGTTKNGLPVEISCDGDTLHFAGMLGVPLQDERRKPVCFAFPVLGITKFSVASEIGRRGLKRESYRKLEILITLWDGVMQSTGAIEFVDGEEVESRLLHLEFEIKASNLKWPLSSGRETAVRRLMVPGKLQHLELLGPQGQGAFASCFDRAPRDLVDCWSVSNLAHSWPLGFEQTDESGSALYLVLLPDRIAFVRPDSISPVLEILASDLTSVDLILGSGDTNGFGCTYLTTRIGTTEQFWLPLDKVDLLQHLYRFILIMWSLNRPFEPDNFIESVSILEREHAEDRMDTVTFATLVSGIAKRASGESVSLTYPIKEEPYIRAPEAKPGTVSKSKNTSTVPIGRAVGVGLVAGAAKSLLSDE